MRIPLEMLAAMGGSDSDGHRAFIRHSCVAFKILRRSAGLLLNLLVLMADARIEDLSQKQATSLALRNVQDRFRLDLDDEAAEQDLIEIIRSSPDRVVDSVMEELHKWRSKFR